MSLILLVGPPGAGKSTFCAHQYPQAKVVHSDDYKSREKPILRAVEALMDKGAQQIVVDACHATRSKRAKLLELAEDCDYRVEAVHIATPADLSVSRLKKRADAGGRKVAPVAVYTYFKRFEPIDAEEEGFDEVTRVDVVNEDAEEETSSLIQMLDGVLVK